MSLARKIVVNNLVVLSQRMGCAVVGLLVSIWLIRYLGAEQFGIYSLVFAWFTFLNVITPPMIEQVVAREAVIFPERMRKYIGAGITLKLGLALLGWIMGVSITYLLGYPRQIIFYLAIVLLGLLGNASYVFQVPHQIELRLFRPVLADGVSNLLYQLGRAGTILIQLGLSAFFWIYLAYRLVQLGFFSLLSLEKKEYRPDFHFGYSEVRGIIQSSWILLVNNIFIMLISRIDQLLLYPVWGERAVGLYASCANLIDYLVLIPSVWYLTVFPLVVRYLGESQEAYQKANYYSFKYLTLSAVLFWIPFAGFSESSIILLFGAEYSNAHSALFWLSSSLIFMFMQVSLLNLALAQKKERLWLWVNGAGALLNILLNLWLIPVYGIVGAGIANFCAYFIQVLLAGIFQEFRKAFFLMVKTCLLPVIIGGGIILVSNWLKLELKIWLPIMLILFLALIFITKVITWKELEVLAKSLKPKVQ